MTANDIPKFDFKVPFGYQWLLQAGLAGFAPGSPLQPWHYLPSRHVIDLRERWPSGPSKSRLVAFAKRQDGDDLACFEVEKDRAVRVVLVHGWTEAGYSIVSAFDNFWEWLKSVVDDIAAWADSAGSDKYGVGS